MKERSEAGKIIKGLVNEFRSRSYEELRAMVGQEPVFGDVVGDSGRKYQYEIEAFWDDRKGGNVRIIGSISPNPDRPIFDRIPLLKLIPVFSALATSDFIKNAAGEFVGE